MAITCTRVSSLTRQDLDLEVLMSQWSSEIHTFNIVRWGESNSILKDVNCLIDLPLLMLWGLFLVKKTT